MYVYKVRLHVPPIRPYSNKNKTLSYPLTACLIHATLDMSCRDPFAIALHVVRIRENPKAIGDRYSAFRFLYLYFLIKM